MASDLNRVMLIGRLTRDPELRYTQNGTSVANFSIANNRTYSAGGEKKEEVSFFNCVAWSKAAEVIEQYCKKGQRIGVEGRLRQRSWEDQDGNKRSVVEVVVENFQFLSSRNEMQASPGGSSYANNEPPRPEADSYSGSDFSDTPFVDDDIPF